MFNNETLKNAPNSLDLVKIFETVSTSENIAFTDRTQKRKNNRKLINRNKRSISSVLELINALKITKTSKKTKSSVQNSRLDDARRVIRAQIKVTLMNFSI